MKKPGTHPADHDGSASASARRFPEGLPLFDVPPEAYGGAPPAHAGGRDTEREAAARVAGRAPTLRMKVLEWIRRAPTGMTDKDLGRLYALERGREANDASCRYSVAPRRCELEKAGYVFDTGERREHAVVWKATGKVGDGRVADLERPS